MQSHPPRALGGADGDPLPPEFLVYKRVLIEPRRRFDTVAFCGLSKEPGLEDRSTQSLVRTHQSPKQYEAWSLLNWNLQRKCWFLHLLLSYWCHNKPLLPLFYLGQGSHVL